jgi:hypothetical protein
VLESVLRPVVQAIGLSYPADRHDHIIGSGLRLSVPAIFRGLHSWPGTQRSAASFRHPHITSANPFFVCMNQA